MSEESQQRKLRPKRRFWRKKRWWIFFLFILSLIWLDGPGWRWIGRQAAERYLPDLGFSGDFELEGRLTSGPIRVRGLEFDSEGVVQHVALEQFEIEYSLWQAIHGEIQAVRLHGLQMDIDLAQSSEAEDEDKEEESTDPRELIAKLRERLLPMEITLLDFSATVRRGNEILFRLAPSSISHFPETTQFITDLGEMKLPGGREIPAQENEFLWEPQRVELDQLTLLEDISLLNLSIQTGVSPEIAGILRIGDTNIDVSTNLDTATVKLSDSIDISEIERIAKIELPVRGRLEALDATIQQLSGGIEEIDAQFQLSLKALEYDDWSSETVNLTLELEDNSLRSEISALPFDAPFKAEVEAEIDRSQNFLPSQINSTITLQQMQLLLTGVRQQLLPSEQELPLPPEGTARIDAKITFDGSQPSLAEADISIQPADKAAPVSLAADWKPDDAIQAALELPGLNFTGSVNPEALSYSGKAKLTEFSPDSLDDWLLPFGIEVPRGMDGTLSWSGSGEIKEVTHRGDLLIDEFIWVQEERKDLPAIKATGKAQYSWPESLTLESLEVVQGQQTFTAKAHLAESFLTVDDLSWKESETVLATGSGKIPLAENPADWKATLQDPRPITLHLETPRLPLQKLHPFLPETVRFPASSTGQVDFKLSGSPRDPLLDATIEAKQIALTDQPDLPPTDINLKATARDKSLKLEGSILASGYPEATLSAVTQWLPAEWAKAPDQLQDAPLDAELKIRNLELSLFSDRVPDVKSIKGTANAKVVVSGTMSAPKPEASIRLSRGAVDWKKAATPDIKSIEIDLEATEESVTIRKGQLEISGSQLNLGGALTLDEFKPAKLDLSVKAQALPVLRNDSLIVRASTNLQLRGPWESAKLSGSVSIIDSLLFKDFEILPIGVPTQQVDTPEMPSIDSATPKEQLAAIPEPFKNWQLDVGLRTANPFLIRGNLAGGEIDINANFGGTISQPRPSGGVTLREVIAQLPFSTLKIPSGKVTFVPDRPFDPRLDIKGESTVRPYELEIFIYGPLSNPRIQPTSNPPLPPSEIMTLVATGTTTEGITNPNAATARAAQLVIEELRRGRIGSMKSMRPLLAVLDKVDFQVGEQNPYTSKTYNSVTFNLDENWLLSAGISEEGYTRAKATYLLRFR